MFALAQGSGASRSCDAKHLTSYVSEPTNALVAEQLGVDPSGLTAKSDILEDLGAEYYHDRSKSYYRMEWRDGKLYQQRYCKDVKGRVFAEFDAKSS